MMPLKEELRTDSGKGLSVALWGIVFLGLLLRVYHYFRLPPMWHDEAALVMNVLRLDFSELLGPLLWHEAAPPLFLWLERAVSLILGDSLPALRLLPFLASCAALLLMVPICRHCLSPAAVPWALLLCSCSDSLLFHACEAKPYALDVFATTVVLAIYCSKRSVGRKLLWLTVAAPLLIFLSYPACFVYGAILLVLLPELWKEKRARFGYAGLALAVGLCSLLLIMGPARAQRDAVMESDWLGFFPDWGRPLSVPLWLLISTEEAFRYCFKPWGFLLPPLCIIGFILLWKNRLQQVALLLMLPFLLTAVAALLHLYPFGGRRVVIFALPGLAVLIGASVPALLSWWRKQWQPGMAFVVLIAVSTVFGAVRRTVAPWPRADIGVAAQWLKHHRADGELILGNDWTHHYYFREAPETLKPLRPGAIPEMPRSPWVLYTEYTSPEARMERIRSHLGNHWEIQKAQHFYYISVFKLTPLRATATGRNGSGS